MDNAVTQERANFRAILQKILESYNEAFARGPAGAYAAASQLVVLHTSTTTLQDAPFKEAWAKLRAGSFKQLLFRDPPVVQRHELDQAYQLFVELLDRRGMGFLLDAGDPLEAEERALLDEITRELDGAAPEVTVDLDANGQVLDVVPGAVA